MKVLMKILGVPWSKCSFCYSHIRTVVNLHPEFSEESLQSHISVITKVHPRVYIHKPQVWNAVYGSLQKQGFKMDVIKSMLLKVPQLLEKHPDHLNSAIQVFRGYDLGEKGVINLFGREPRLLLLDGHAMKKKLGVLFTVFPKSDILKMLKKGDCAAAIFLEPWDITMEKLRYIEHEMGYDQSQMVAAQVLNYSLDHIFLRYNLFLRCGKFKRPNPKITNPKELRLKVILTSENDQLPRLTGISLEEYHIFCQLIEEEKQREVDEQDDDE